MTYHELVAQFKEKYEQVDAGFIAEHIAYQFNVTGEAEGAFYLEISEGKVHVMPYEYFDRDVLFTISEENLLMAAAGKLDLVAAALDGTIRVEGDMDKALRLKEFMEHVTAALQKKGQEPGSKQVGQSEEKPAEDCKTQPENGQSQDSLGEEPAIQGYEKPEVGQSEDGSAEDCKTQPENEDSGNQPELEQSEDRLASGVEDQPEGVDAEPEELTGTERFEDSPEEASGFQEDSGNQPEPKPTGEKPEEDSKTQPELEPAGDSSEWASEDKPAAEPDGKKDAGQPAGKATDDIEGQIEFTFTEDQPDTAENGSPVIPEETKSAGRPKVVQPTGKRPDLSAAGKSHNKKVSRSARKKNKRKKK